MLEERKSNILKCSGCHNTMEYSEDETWIDDKGSGYSTKLIRCGCCQKINLIKYFIDENMNLNNDKRFYDYRRK